MSEGSRFQDLEAHLAHDLVVGSLEDPVLEAVLACSLAGDQIDVRDGDVRVWVAALGVEVYNDVTRRVRCDLFRQGVRRVSLGRARQRRSSG